MNQEKPLWRSRTFWLNTLALAVAVVQGLGGPLPEVDAQTYGGVLALVNIALRLYTKSAVTVKPAQ